MSTVPPPVANGVSSERILAGRADHAGTGVKHWPDHSLSQLLFILSLPLGGQGAVGSNQPALSIQHWAGE